MYKCPHCGTPMIQPARFETYWRCPTCGATFLKHLFERNDFAHQTEQTEENPR
jgi:ribosomal protein L37AE/L43A